MAEKNPSTLTNAVDILKKHPVLTGLASMCIVGLILIWIVMIFLNIWTHHGDDSTVPEIKHTNYVEAKQRLNDAQLAIEISDSIYDTSYPPGTIVESWPKAGSQVKRGRKVYVTITAFSPKHVTLSMPITGVSARQAISYLNAMGITSVRIVDVPSQFPNLVEKAHFNSRPLGVGSVLPVDANVVLEVGQYVEPDEEDSLYDDEAGGAAEDAVISDLGVDGHSVYIDDDER